MPRSTETHCSPRYSPLIVLYVLSARITATRIAANKSGKTARGDSPGVWFAPLLYAYHFSRHSYDGRPATPTIARHRHRIRANIQAREAVVFLAFIRRRRRRRIFPQANSPQKIFRTGQSIYLGFYGRAISSRRPAKSFSRRWTTARSPSRVVLSARGRRARRFAHNSLTRTATFQLFTRDHGQVTTSKRTYARACTCTSRRGKPREEASNDVQGATRVQMDPAENFRFSRSSRRRPPWWKIRISVGIVASHSVFRDNCASRKRSLEHRSFLSVLSFFFFFFVFLGSRDCVNTLGSV